MLDQGRPLVKEDAEKYEDLCEEKLWATSTSLSFLFRGLGQYRSIKNTPICVVRKG